MNSVLTVLGAIAISFTPTATLAQTNPWMAVPGTGYELKLTDIEWGPEESIQIEARPTARKSQRSRMYFACGRNAYAIASGYSIEQARWIPNPYFQWLAATEGSVGQILYSVVCEPPENQ